MPMTITWDRDEAQQESSFMNATLADFADGIAISTAVTVSCPRHVDPTDRAAVEAWLRSTFEPVERAGCDVEFQIGRARP